MVRAQRSPSDAVRTMDRLSAKAWAADGFEAIKKGRSLERPFAVNGGGSRI